MRRAVAGDILRLARSHLKPWGGAANWWGHSRCPDISADAVRDEALGSAQLKKRCPFKGHRTDTASDGFQALEKLRRRTYDLILCDLKMPGLSGQAVYEEIAEKWPEMCERIIFLTGDLVDPRTRAFLDRVQRPVIEKPFQVEDLVRILREHLG